MTRKRISKFEDRAIEIIQSEKEKKGWRESLTEPVTCGTISKDLTQVPGIPEGGEARAEKNIRIWTKFSEIWGKV